LNRKSLYETIESAEILDFPMLTEEKSTKYKTYVQYVPNKNDCDGIEWYCTCLSGCRTVGCCSHIASVIYYLSNAKWNNDFVAPAQE